MDFPFEVTMTSSFGESRKRKLGTGQKNWGQVNNDGQYDTHMIPINVWLFLANFMKKGAYHG